MLLQHRAEWSHHGGTWGLLGGARHSAETAEQAAAREATEESGLDPRSYTVTGRFVDDHGGWSYTTVIARTGTAALPRALTAGDPRGALGAGRRAGPAAAAPRLRRHLGAGASIAQASNAAGSMVTGNGSTSLSGCPGSARPTST